MNCKYCGSKLICPTCGEERDWTEIEEKVDDQVNSVHGDVPCAGCEKDCSECTYQP